MKSEKWWFADAEPCTDAKLENGERLSLRPAARKSEVRSLKFERRGASRVVVSMRRFSTGVGQGVNEARVSFSRLAGVNCHRPRGCSCERTGTRAGPRLFAEPAPWRSLDRTSTGPCLCFFACDLRTRHSPPSCSSIAADSESPSHSASASKTRQGSPAASILRRTRTASSLPLRPLPSLTP